MHSEYTQWVESGWRICSAKPQATLQNQTKTICDPPCTVTCQVISNSFDFCSLNVSNFLSRDYNFTQGE